MSAPRRRILVRQGLAALALVVAAGIATPEWPAIAATQGTHDVSTAAAVPADFSARALVAQASSELEAGHPGPAILHLERARLLAPRSSFVAASLERARAAAHLPTTASPPWRRAVHELAPDEWTLIAMIGLMSVAAGLVAASWSLRSRRRLAPLIAGGLALTAIGFGASFYESPSRERAIVVAPDVVARVAPFAGAEVAFPAREGAAVRVERSFRDYVLVSGPEGRGWIPERSAETVLPEHGDASRRVVSSS